MQSQDILLIILHSTARD